MFSWIIFKFFGKLLWLEEELFKDQGDKVPAEMTLHEVLQRLLYKERPASPYYFGVVGPYEDIITFTYGGDYTSEIDGNVVPNKSNTPSDATSAFNVKVPSWGGQSIII